MTPPFAFFHDDLLGVWWQFARPIASFEVTQSADLLPTLHHIESAVEREGVWAVGWLSYEASGGFDPALITHPPNPRLPLAWFALCHPPHAVNWPPCPPMPTYSLSAWQPQTSAEAYRAALAQIHHHIAQGETYQVNYTMRLQATFQGEPFHYFQTLQQAQNGRFGAYLETDQLAICSASPELFFQLNGDKLISRPMKGTAKRGLTWAEDHAQAEWLRLSEKNQAENVMIVDMIRNDLSRVAQPNSVNVARLFEVTRYPTLWQMSSTVQAKTTAPISEIMRAMFPCASITGAPKVRTMQLIAQLESVPRGVYTGSLGFVAPQRRAQFNVAIRTVTIEKERESAEYGTGSGVVWDSVADEEYHETRLKADVLTVHRPSFELLEGILWQPESGYLLLERHLTRLAHSADYFQRPFSRLATEKALHEYALQLHEPCKVRLLLVADGRVHLEATPLEPLPQPQRLAWAFEPVNSADPFLYHKTTHRVVYEQRRRPDADDTLLWNERGEITETTRANLIIERDGQFLTPALSCGLLAGTMRQQLLAEGKISEAIIYRSEIGRDTETKLWLINSVRGWLTTVLI